MVLGAIWGSFQYKKGDREGYSRGYQKGANDQYKGDYKKRLLRHEQRVAAKEKNTQPASDDQDDLLNLGLKKEGE
jgi:hypothetical protein